MKSESPRLIGSIIAFIGIFLIGFDWYLTKARGHFFSLAAIIGPTATAYGFSILINPPPKMPQTEFGLIYKIFAGIGFCLGLSYFFLLKLGF
jgi:hypothetical protein